jgi:hypothetical protein
VQHGVHQETRLWYSVLVLFSLDPVNTNTITDYDLSDYDLSDFRYRLVCASTTAHAYQESEIQLYSAK